jgi:alkylation response protein AidB-like acyl-CoA dehydrogenase
MRLNALRTLARMEDNALSREGMITKLYWASVHRRLGQLAVDVLGADGMIAAAAGVTDERYPISDAQRLFLWTRADTIYGGSNQIQRNQIGERALGLPPEPKVVKT